MDLDELDRRLAAIGPWIQRGGSALMRFYAGDGAFQRDSLSRETNATTSRTRSFLSLVEYVRYLHEEDLWDPESRPDHGQLREAVRETGRTLVENWDTLREASANKKNMFTDAHLLLALCLLDRPFMQDVFGLHLSAADQNRLKAGKAGIAKSMNGGLDDWRGGKVYRSDVATHDLVTLHALRALDVASWLEREEGISGLALTERVHADVLCQLGYRAAGVYSRFDPSELMFNVAVLARLEEDPSAVTRSAVEAVVQAQNPDGSWPTARIISYTGKRILHVASSEVALALTHLLQRRLARRDPSWTGTVIEAIDRAFDLIQTTFEVLTPNPNGDEPKRDPPLQGWANDHTRLRDLVESWATAIVLLFLIHYRDVLLECRQQQILTSYRTDPAPTSSLLWPDLGHLLRPSGEVTAADLRLPKDPTSRGDLSERVVRSLIRPVTESWIQRPDKVSVILDGPPGTGKTSLVRSMARVLNWPLVSLSPPDFLKRGGLEGFFASADRIFDDLRKLRRVVVLFDESEDFFKKRESRQQLEARTLGAFITPGMLPWLQSLRDERWTLFVLATNSEIEALDPAAIREGRFDWDIRLGHPGVAVQERYVRSKGLPSTVEEVLIAALRLYTHFQEPESGEPVQGDRPAVSFALLDDLATRYKDRGGDLDATEVLDHVQHTLSRPGPPSLLDD